MRLLPCCWSEIGLFYGMRMGRGHWWWWWWWPAGVFIRQRSSAETLFIQWFICCQVFKHVLLYITHSHQCVCLPSCGDQTTAPYYFCLFMVLTHFQQTRPIYYRSLATIAEGWYQGCKYLNGLFFSPHFPFGFLNPNPIQLHVIQSVVCTQPELSESLSHKPLRWESVCHMHRAIHKSGEQ